jgi:hypothetical protein
VPAKAAPWLHRGTSDKSASATAVTVSNPYLRHAATKPSLLRTLGETTMLSTARAPIVMTRMAIMTRNRPLPVLCNGFAEETDWVTCAKSAPDETFRI